MCGIFGITISPSSSLSSYEIKPLIGKIFLLSESVNADHKLVHQRGLVNMDQSLENFVNIERFISLADHNKIAPPDFLSDALKACFEEAAACLSIGCWNAAGTMFRMCVDLATKGLLPKEEVDGLNSRTRRDLGLRLPWLLDNGYLPENLRELSNCIREDGNDGAHAGTLEKEDAEDLLDFTYELLERLFTEPGRLQRAEERRKVRRQQSRS